MATTIDLLRPIIAKYPHYIRQVNGCYGIIVNADSALFLQQTIELERPLFDAILTDPPYLFEMNSKPTRNASSVNKIIRSNATNISFISEGFDWRKYFEIFEKVCYKPRYSIFCSNKQVGDFMVYFQQKKQHPTLMVWHKKNAVPAVNQTYLPNLEFIVNVRGKGSYFNNDLSLKEKSKIFTGCCVQGNQHNKRYHPTQKPIDILTWQLKSISRIDDWILDPFAGSSGTAIASLKLHRNCVCIEKSAEFYKNSIARLQQEIGLYD